MRFEIDGRIIQQNNTVIGVQGDNGVETVEFVIPRFYKDVDLNEGLAFAVYKLPDKTEDQVQLDMELLEISEEAAENKQEYLLLRWIIGSQITPKSGILEFGLKISGLDGILWGSQLSSFRIERSIPFESPQQPIYFSRARTRELRLVGSESSSYSIADIPMLATEHPENEPPITVAERKINIPAELRTIAVQNDANSETVAIQMPRYFDGNDLYQYSIFLKTIMPDDGGRDDVALFPSLLNSTTLTMNWTLKPPQTSFTGALGIQIYVIGTKSDGSDFKWETYDATINIARSLDADAAIPTEPSIYEDFLKQISAIKNQAKESETKAANSATNAASSATQAASSASNAANSAANAATSATNAKKSEENAKKSETAAADSLTDINSGLAGKLPITSANNLIKNVSLEQKTGVFTFTRYDDTTFQIDTALEKVVLNFKYDSANKQLVLKTEDGQEYRINMSAFIDIYTGQDSETITTTVNDNKIKASIKGASISKKLLDSDLSHEIDDKVTSKTIGNASQILFSDGKTMQEKLDSGDLNGKDGTGVLISGMFYMSVNEFGHLILSVADDAEKPPLSINEDGHLIYTID